MQIKNNFVQPQMLKKSNTSFNGFNTGTVKKGVKSVGKGFMDAIDFETKNTPRKAIMMLYSGCILSRLAFSRDKYEFSETALRDSFGWTALFFASIAAEKTLAYLADKVFSKAKDTTTSLFMNKKGTKAPENLWQVLKPKSDFVLKVVEDIECVKDPIKKKAVMKAKNFSYFGSIIFAAAALGFGIPFLNTINTKRQLAREKTEQPNNINMNKFLQITK